MVFAAVCQTLGLGLFVSVCGFGLCFAGWLACAVIWDHVQSLFESARSLIQSTTRARGRHVSLGRHMPPRICPTCGQPWPVAAPESYHGSGDEGGDVWSPHGPLGHPTRRWVTWRLDTPRSASPASRGTSGEREEGEWRPPSPIPLLAPEGGRGPALHRAHPGLRPRVQGRQHFCYLSNCFTCYPMRGFF